MNFFQLFGMSGLQQILFLLLLAFIIEQIFLVFLGSYPYRWGLTVKRLHLTVRDIHQWREIKGLCTDLAIKVDEKRLEVYFRHRYHWPYWGPFLFVGQIKNITPAVLLIRMSPTSFMLVLYMLINVILSVHNYNFQSFLNMFIVLIVVLMFYRQFLGSYVQCERLFRIITEKRQGT